jgi:hypothetical protein
MKTFLWFGPFVTGILCDFFAMVTWEFIERIALGRNLPNDVFLFTYDICMFLNEKNLNALWVPAILQAFEVDLF